MEGDIVEQGVELMLFGMGTVVIFLTSLICITTAMSWFLGRYFPEPVEVPVIGSGATPQTARAPQGKVPPVAIITAAIHQHRAKNK